MKTLPEQTARFAAVVEAAGKPRPLVLWTDPRQDRRLMAAVQKDRVMTIKPAPNATKKDVGLVGFLPEKGASYLVFPKPIAQFKGRRIVGIKYDLVKTPGPIGRVVRPGGGPRRAARTLERFSGTERFGGTAVRERSAPEKRPKKFRVIFRFTASAEVRQEVPADNRRQARELAERSVVTPDLAHGTITRKIVRVVAMP